MMRLQVMKPADTSKMMDIASIRPAALSDLKELISLDEEVTGLAKPNYWKETFTRHGVRRRSPRFFLVAERRNRIEGFIIAEVREWEFGEPPCGWILAIQVRPRTRLKGVGTQLFDGLCQAFRRAGISKVRTLLLQDNHLVLSFFRSQGMMAGPFIELEAVLD